LFIGITKISGLSLFVSIVGLALSIYYRKLNPKKFRFTSIAFGLFLIGAIISGLLSAWIDIGSLQASASQSQTAMGYSAITCISSLFQIAAWVLLFIVIFSPKANESVSDS
jgi:disulfide bond formation protein DsbB